MTETEKKLKYYSYNMVGLISKTKKASKNDFKKYEFSPIILK